MKYKMFFGLFLLFLVALSALTARADTCSFTRNLTVGSTGDDVKCLQQFLNANGYTIAVSGTGSSGNETTYFGSLTKTAVAKWQTASGIAPATGYFGAISRAKYSAAVPIAMCDYANPPQGCSYVQGSSYNSKTNCGMVLSCPAAATSTSAIICNDFWWTDPSHPTCQGPKQFCGNYMYQGLRLSNSQDECRAAAGTAVPVPAAISLSPNAGMVGTKIVISGSGFTSANNIVYFGNEYLPFARSSIDGKIINFTIPTTLQPPIPTCATGTSCVQVMADAVSVATGTYPVKVGASKSADFMVTATNDPVIVSISPSSGRAGSVATIRGFKLTADSKIYFGDGYLPLSVKTSALDGTELSFVVPSSLQPITPPCSSGAYCLQVIPAPMLTIGTYPVKVTNSGGTSNIIDFVVVQ